MEQNQQITNIARSVSILPHVMRYFLGTFKPEFDIPIKKNEVKALFELSRHPNLPMKHYIDVVDMESGSFTYLADKLEDKGLITRVPAEDDKRVTVLSLTDSGEALCKALQEKIGAHVSEKISGLDQESLEEFSQAIMLLEGVMEKLENTES